MTDIQIPREAVDAGARAIMRSAYAGDDSEWDKLQPSQQHIVRERAMEVINATAQLIVAAELERMASLLRVQARLCPCTKGGEWQPGSNCINRAHANTVQRIEEYGTRAAELRAQS